MSVMAKTRSLKRETGAMAGCVGGVVKPPGAPPRDHPPSSSTRRIIRRLA
jgi:hypothetical protein